MEELLTFLKNGLSNEFAKAGIVTVLFSGILYSLKGYFQSLWTLFEQSIKSTATFRSNSGYYDLLTQYLLTILPKVHYDTNSKIASGIYYRFINGKFSVIHIYSETLMDRYIHIIKITSYFSRSLPEFLNKQLKTLSESKIKISTHNDYVTTKFLPHKNKVLLPTKSGRQLYKIVEKVIKSDISRVGILLYGDPGSGKSRAIIEIAQKFGLNLKLISIDSTSTLGKIQYHLHSEDEIDQNLFGEAKLDKSPTPAIVGQSGMKRTKDINKTIILLEDVDRLRIFQEGDQETKFNLTKVDLLNTFDGILAPENCIIIATANDYNKIEPALIRAGRFDIHLKFTNPDEKEIASLYRYLMKKDCNGFIAKNKGKSLADIFNAIKLEKLKSL